MKIRHRFKEIELNTGEEYVPFITDDGYEIKFGFNADISMVQIDMFGEDSRFIGVNKPGEEVLKVTIHPHNDGYVEINYSNNDGIQCDFLISQNETKDSIIEYIKGEQTLRTIDMSMGL